MLSFVTLYAPDPDRTLRVYRALGLEFVEERHGDGPLHHACVTAGIALEVYPGPGEGGVAPGVLLGFDVVDLDRVRERLLEEGVELRREVARSDGVRSLMFSDPDGRRVMLREQGDL